MGSGTILKNKKFCRDQKQIFFLKGPKLKRGIFAGTSAIFKPIQNQNQNQNDIQYKCFFPKKKKNQHYFICYLSIPIQLGIIL